MLNDLAVVEQKSKGMNCLIGLTAIMGIIMMGSNIYLNVWIAQKISNSKQPSFISSLMDSTITFNMTNSSNIYDKICNYSHVIYGYKRMFEISNLLHDMLDKDSSLERFRDLINYITAPVFISEVDSPNKDIYKAMFLSALRKLATQNLNENEQRLLLYTTDFVNAYLSV